MTVAFAAESEAGKGAVGVFSNSDNTFTVKGITPGRYKVTVVVSPYSNDKKRTPLFEPLNLKYGPKESNLRCDVTADANQAVTIDLSTDKGTVTVTKS